MTVTMPLWVLILLFLMWTFFGATIVSEVRDDFVDWLRKKRGKR
jgi:hypothetical protein